MADNSIDRAHRRFDELRGYGVQIESRAENTAVALLAAVDGKPLSQIGIFGRHDSGDDDDMGDGGISLQVVSPQCAAVVDVNPDGTFGGLTYVNDDELSDMACGSIQQAAEFLIAHGQVLR